MKRSLSLVTLGFLFLVVVAIVWPIVRVHQLEKSFGEVKIGDTKSRVRKRMGAPWKDEECGKYLGGRPVGCVTEFIYAHPYAPYAPEYWEISFDSNNQTISNIHLVSP
jgi:hypothetical protein